jgi:outer membrane protein assembly factor BamB
LGDERLESIMPEPFGLEGLEQESPALLDCVSDETAREIFLADTAAQLGGLTGGQDDCLRTLFGNFSPSELAAASSGEPTPENAMMMLSFGLGLVACLPELAAQSPGGVPAGGGGSGPPQLGQEPSLLWSFTTGGWVVTAPAVVNGVVYAGSDDHSLYALDAVTGGLLWSHATGDVIRSTPTVVDGKVFFGSNDNHLYALDAASGAELWKHDTGEWVQYSPAVSKGRVYFAAPSEGDQKLHAADAATGEVIWVAEHPFPIGAEHTPTPISNRVYAPGADYGQFFALNAATGQTVWQAEVGGYVESAPTVQDGMVYLTVANRAYAFNEMTGEIIWEVNTEEFPARDFPALVVDGVYYLAPSNKVYALDAATGEEVWSYESSMLSTAPVVTGRVLYGATDVDGAVFALDAATGQEIWKEYTGGQVIQSLTASDGLLFGESDSGALVAADANSGVRVWSFEKGGFSDVRGYTVKEGMVYSAGPNNSVYAHHAP